MIADLPKHGVKATCQIATSSSRDVKTELPSLVLSSVHVKWLSCLSRDWTAAQASFVMFASKTIMLASSRSTHRQISKWQVKSCVPRSCRWGAPTNQCNESCNTSHWLVRATHLHDNGTRHFNIYSLFPSLECFTASGFVWRFSCQRPKFVFQRDYACKLSFDNLHT